MSLAVESPKTTIEQLLAMPGSEHYELLAGHLMERNMSTDASETIAMTIFRLQAFLVAHPVGVLMAPEQGFRIFTDAQTVRRPDIAFLRMANRPVAPAGLVTVAPDLVVEVVSLNDIGGEIRSKVDQWLQAGVRVVWVLWPGSREAHIYRVASRPALLTAADTISGDDVLPGFSCLVDDLFPIPVSPTALAS